MCGYLDEKHSYMHIVPIPTHTSVHGNPTKKKEKKTFTLFSIQNGSVSSKMWKMELEARKKTKARERKVVTFSQRLVQNSSFRLIFMGLFIKCVSGSRTFLFLRRFGLNYRFFLCVGGGGERQLKKLCTYLYYLVE